MKSSHHPRMHRLAGAILLFPAVCFAQQPDAHEQYKQTINQLAPQIQQQSMAALTDALKAGGKSGPVMDVSAMQALLPEAVADLKRIHVSGKTGGTEGIMQMASAEATYADESGGQTLAIRFNDMGGIPGVASAIKDAKNSQAAAEDQYTEDENGYTRMSKIDGFPAVEVYSVKSRQGTLTITAGDRIVITVSGNNVPADIFKKTTQELDLKKISELTP